MDDLSERAIWEQVERVAWAHGLDVAQHYDVLTDQAITTLTLTGKAPTRLESMRQLLAILDALMAPVPHG